MVSALYETDGTEASFRSLILSERSDKNQRHEYSCREAAKPGACTSPLQYSAWRLWLPMLDLVERADLRKCICCDRRTPITASTERPVHRAAGAGTANVRNGFGEVIRKTSPDRGVTVMESDEPGLMKQRQDGRGVLIP